MSAPKFVYVTFDDENVHEVDTDLEYIADCVDEAVEDGYEEPRVARYQLVDEGVVARAETKYVAG